MSKKNDIVDNVIARLPAGTGLTPETTHKNPFREVAESELPALKVALMRGRSDEINTQIEYERLDTLVVAWIDQGNDDALIERLYDAEEKISNFLINDANNNEITGNLRQLVDDLTHTNFDMDLKNAGAGTGAIVLTFDIKYHTTHSIEFEDLEGYELEVRPKEAADSDITVFTDSVDLPTD